METPSQPPHFARPSLWNPNPACSWSVLFTPALGAYLHYRNWQELGETAKARSSILWFRGILAVLILWILVPDQLLPVPEIIRRLPFILLILWYFISGRAQMRYVKQHLPGGYQKKGWGKPLLIAFAAVVCYALCAMLITMVYVTLGIVKVS